MGINLWLDDDRRPPSFADCGIHWKWALTADEAIEILEEGNVVWASLDHDLDFEHYGQDWTNSNYKPKEKTGMVVLEWMKENNVWPEFGVRIHTMNIVRKPKMLQMVEDQYDRTFQLQYKGTHKV